MEEDFKAHKKWQGWQDLNPRHAVLETAALPTELHPYIMYSTILSYFRIKTLKIC